MTQKQLYDRKSLEDARIVFEELVPNLDTRTKLAEFMLDAVQYAEQQKPGNWNVNLDPHGKFIKMNVGFLYCILIRNVETLIICNRNTLQFAGCTDIDKITYLGYKKKTPIPSKDIHEVPDCLVRAPGSVGCLVDTAIIATYLEFFKQSNFDFIKAASQTYQFDRIRNAHSPGMMDYLNSIVPASQSSGKKLRPAASVDRDLPLIEHELEKQEERVKQSRLLTDEARKERLKQAQRYPAQKAAVVIVFDRNEDVIVEVLGRANGRCERCGHHAPFVKDRDGSAYLEVHHRKPLSEQGEDTVENAIALCPNCHRHAHYGKASFSWTERASCSCSPLRPPHR